VRVTPAPLQRALAVLLLTLVSAGAVRSAETTTPGGANAPQATPAPVTPPAPAEKPPLPTWHVTPDITFVPGLRVQGRYIHNDVQDHRFIVQRFRLKGSGAAYGIARYGAEMKIDNTGSSGNTTAQVENAWLEIGTSPNLNLRAGLYDLPFSRVALTSDSKLLLMDRGLTKDAMTAQGLADNTIGALLHGRPCGGRFEYGAGLFQNVKFNEFPMPAARVAVNLLDPAPAGGYGDYRGSYNAQGRRLALGANTAYASNVQDGLNEYDLLGWGVDLFSNLGPVTLQAEYDRFSKDMSGAMPDVHTNGWYVQAGSVLPLEHLEPPSWLPQLELVARYEDLHDDVVNDRFQWVTVGLNLYIRSHNLKLQTEYTMKRDGATPIGNDLIQVQLQLDF